MTKIPLEFRFERNEEGDLENLVKDLRNMYRILATAINEKPDVISRIDSSGMGIDGQTTDTAYGIGTINVNQTSEKIEVLSQHDSAVTVKWKTVS